MKHVQRKSAVRAGACAIALLVLGADSALAAAPAPPDPAKLEKIRVQLLYERTGTLSEDIAPPSKFAIWNAVIGEGSAKEPATDVLVSAVVGGVKDEENSTRPLTITVKDKKGKVLGQRTFSNMLIGEPGLVKSLLLRDAACAGPITIEVSFNGVHKKTSIDMACGE